MYIIKTKGVFYIYIYYKIEILQVIIMFHKYMEFREQNRIIFYNNQTWKVY